MKFFANIMTKTTSTTLLGAKKKNAIVMGRLTWQSIPASRRPLKDRINIIVSSCSLTELITDKSSSDDVYVVGSLQEAISLIESDHDLSDRTEKIVVIGGARLFEDSLTHPNFSSLYLTEVDASFECDVFLTPRSIEIVKSLTPSVVHADITECDVTYRKTPSLVTLAISSGQPGLSTIFARNFSALKSSPASFKAHHHDTTHAEDDHHHHDDDHVDHGPVGPYDLKHHATYPKEAYFLGINPKEYKSEGFEAITIVTYILMFGILALTFTAKESDSFREWAIREAKAREEVREAGGEIEFGKYYSTPSYEEDEEDKIPKMAEAAEE